MKSAYSSKVAMNLRDLMTEFSEKIKESREHWEKVVIIVDGLDKISQDTVSTQVLFFITTFGEIIPLEI